MRKPPETSGTRLGENPAFEAVTNMMIFSRTFMNVALSCCSHPRSITAIDQKGRVTEHVSPEEWETGELAEAELGR